MTLKARPKLDCLKQSSSSAPASPTALRRLASSAALSVLFVVVYGGCNWITSLRSNLGTIAFAWERHIPFVPVMIPPYLSLDAFFIAAPFLCRTEEELSVFARRIAAAVVTAGICFLLFPFRFAFARPIASGWDGAIFDWFRMLDAPFNLFPSLHIALCALLSVTYARHTRGWLRVVVLGWFVLIGASAVLTYQHHVLDVLGGLALAGYCFYFLRDEQWSEPATTNPRIGWYYIAGAAVLCAIVIASWPYGAVLIWPVASCVILAGGYFCFGGSVYRKCNGVLPWSAIWALAPVLVGQHLSRWCYRRQCRRYDVVTSGVWIGGALNNREAFAAANSGVTAILDLTAEFSAPRAARGLRYLNLPVLDLTAPTQQQLSEMAEFIRKESRRGVVYVHCKIGYSRSAAAVGAWLIATGEAADAETAVAPIRSARPQLVVRVEVVEALAEFTERRRGAHADTANLPLNTTPLVLRASAAAAAPTAPAEDRALVSARPAPRGSA